MGNVVSLSERIKEIADKKNAVVANSEPTQEHLDFHASLMRIARTRGFSPGWAWHVFFARFGFYLNGELIAVKASPEAIAFADAHQAA